MFDDNHPSIDIQRCFRLVTVSLKYLSQPTGNIIHVSKPMEFIQQSAGLLLSGELMVPK